MFCKGVFCWFNCYAWSLKNKVFFCKGVFCWFSCYAWSLKNKVFCKGVFCWFNCYAWSLKNKVFCKGVFFWFNCYAWSLKNKVLHSSIHLIQMSFSALCSRPFCCMLVWIYFPTTVKVYFVGLFTTSLPCFWSWFPLQPYLWIFLEWSMGIELLSSLAKAFYGLKLDLLFSFFLYRSGPHWRKTETEGRLAEQSYAQFRYCIVT